MANIVCGWSEVTDVEGIWKVFEQLKGLVEKHTGKNYEVFRPISYRDQVVAGMNYSMKIYVGEEKYLHVTVLQRLPCDGGGIKVFGVRENKTKDDPLVPIVN